MNAQLLDSSNTDSTTDATLAQADEATRDSHPPSPPASSSAEPVVAQTAPTLIDRMAMRVGLALVLWGRRGHGRPSALSGYHHNTRLTRNERERLARETVWLHTALTRR